MNQLDINFSRIARDKGIEQAILNAERVHEDWGDRAYHQFTEFLSQREEPFKIETFREWAKNTLPEPPSLRAFGAIAVRAVKAGLIKRIDYVNVENAKAHRTPVSLWVKIT